MSHPTEPDRVRVKHVLIGVRGGWKDVQRTATEAREIAKQVLRLAEGREDFDRLIAEFSDAPPTSRDDEGELLSMLGVERPVDDPLFRETLFIANVGVSPKASWEIRRQDIVPGIGGVAFSLRVGEVGILYYDSVISPFGFHVIKRIS